MKKTLAALISALLVLAILSGCAGKPVAVEEIPEAPAPAPAEPAPESVEAPAEDVAEAAELKTGLSILVSLGKSKDATAEEDGLAQANISLVAVLVDDQGVIWDCVIDMVQSKIAFGSDGLLVTDPATEFLSKNELGDDYGLRNASSIGKEWNEQAAAFADYAVGKTLEEIRGIAVDDSMVPTGEDLTASVTLSIGGFVAGIEDAVARAEHRGAREGDELHLVSVTDASKSKDASDEGDGLAQAYATIAAVTLNGETITSCYIDAVQANVNFSAEGLITSDLSVAPSTKNDIGDGYGMIKASSIGKEWYEQAAAFCGYVTGKTVEDVGAIAVNERTSPTEADLSASVTIGIGDFQTLLAKTLS